MHAMVAVSENGVIGSGNKLPWNVPEDTQFYKDTTSDGTVVYGRKTYESTGSKPLPGRPNVVFTSSKIQDRRVKCISKPEELLEIEGKIWICGGEQIYRLLLPACRTLFLSRIRGTYKGDTVFPDYEDIFTSPQVLIKHEKFYVTKFINKEYQEMMENK